MRKVLVVHFVITNVTSIVLQFFLLYFILFYASMFHDHIKNILCLFSYSFYFYFIFNLAKKLFKHQKDNERLNDSEIILTSAAPPSVP